MRLPIADLPITHLPITDLPFTDSPGTDLGSSIGIAKLRPQFFHSIGQERALLVVSYPLASTGQDTESIAQVGAFRR